jgi:hypothetical protein
MSLDKSDGIMIRVEAIRSRAPTKIEMEARSRFGLALRPFRHGHSSLDKNYFELTNR